MAQNYSIHRDPKKHPTPFKPHEFNPYRPKPKPRILTPEMFDRVFGD